MNAPRAEGRRQVLPDLDARLKAAASRDFAADVGELISCVSFRCGGKAVHSIRTRDVLTCFGWTAVRYPYRRRKEPAGDAFAAFRINRKMTRHASEVSTTLAVRLGSFRETRETLRLLGGGTVSTSKIRDETLCVGGQALEGLKKPAADVRVYTVAAMNAPEDGKRVERTLVAMADGTNVHCVKKDTAGIEGRNGGEAGSRQIRVMTFA